MASAEEVARFRADGWLAVQGVFTAREMDVVAAAAGSCCDRELTGETLPLLGDDNAAPSAIAGSPSAADERWVAGNADRAPDGTLLPRKLQQPFRKHAAFRRVATSPRLLALAASLLEPAGVTAAAVDVGDDPPATAPMLLTDQAFMKPPLFGTAKPYHQDNYYLGLVSAGCLLTAWVALDAADADNGCLRYLAGSHHGGVVEHIATDPAAPFNLDAPPAVVEARGGGPGLPREQLGAVGKGSVLFHHGATLHASGYNSSARWRRGYALHFAAAGAVFDSPARDLQRTGYCYQGWFAAAAAAACKALEEEAGEADMEGGRGRIATA